jgi:hypothetical protein
MAESIVQVTEGSGKKLHTNSRVIGANTVEDEYILHGENFLASYICRAGAAISAATANDHLLQLMAGSTLNLYIRRVRIYQAGLATTAAIATIQLWRLTTAGTGGVANTPQPYDSTDAASGATGMTLPTAKGTETTHYVGVTAGFIQTVPTGGLNTLILDIDFDKLRIKCPRIPAGTANGFAIKNTTAIAAATVFPVIDFVEANF